MAIKKEIAMHDLHVHLYGCVTPLMIWNKLRDLKKLESDEREFILQRIIWFENEFNQTFKKSSEISNALNSDTPLLVENIYCVTKPSTFHEFQTRFNLAIAAFPILYAKSTVLTEVLKLYSTDDACEFRIFLAPYLGKIQLDEYLQKIFSDLTQYPSCFKLAFSLQRNLLDFTTQMDYLDTYFSNNPTHKAYLTGIDLSGYENLQNFADLKIMQKKVEKFGRSFPQKISLLLHLGETWNGLCPELKLQEIYEITDLTHTRLGHASIVGVDSKVILKSNILDLPERTLVGDCEKFTALADRSERIFELQNLILQKLKSQKTLIESCPTSNLYLGELTEISELPIFRFLQHDLNVVVATDDPGIFKTDLNHEFSLLNLPVETVDRLRKRAHDIFNI